MRRKSVTASTRAQLVAAGKLDCALGSAAMTYAARLDDPDTAASAVAAIGKELRSTLEELTRGVAVASDPVDDLKAKRDARRKAGA